MSRMSEYAFAVGQALREIFQGLKDSLDIGKLRTEINSMAGEKAIKVRKVRDQFWLFFFVLLFMVLVITFLPLFEDHVSSVHSSIPPEERGWMSGLLITQVYILLALRFIFLAVLFVATKLLASLHFSKLTSELFCTPVGQKGGSFVDKLSNIGESATLVQVPFIFAILAGFIPYLGFFLSLFFNILYYCLVATSPRLGTLGPKRQCLLIENCWPYFLGFTLIPSIVATLPFFSLVLCLASFLDIWMTASGTQISTSVRVQPPVTLGLFQISIHVAGRLINGGIQLL